MRGIHRILEILFGSAFRIDGQWVPAKEGTVMGRYDRAKRLMLRGMTENRYWSWTDEKSLVQLLPLL